MLAAHRPISIGEDAGPTRPNEPGFEYSRWVRAAIEESGVRVHLFLSGHHHSLQILEQGGGELGPDLHVVVGSGARYRKILAGHPGRRYQAERLGFVRVDVVDAVDVVDVPEPRADHATGDKRTGRLVVSLFQSPTIPLLSFGGPELVARWSVGLAGDLVRADR